MTVLTAPRIIVPHLSDYHVALIETHYSPKDARLIYDTLSDAELRAIDDTDNMDYTDYKAVAWTNKAHGRLKPARINQLLDNFRIMNQIHFNLRQLDWLDYQRRICQQEEHRPLSLQVPEEGVHIFQEFHKRGNNTRFRAYYVIKNQSDPNLVQSRIVLP